MQSSFTNSSPLHILGISGSLRRASTNTGLLRAAADLLPPAATLEIAQIGDLPLYNGDIDGPVQPAPVQRLKKQVAAADALLFASPEYNYSFTGALKNAIDWLSRPRPDSPLIGKPAAIVGTGGKFGTVRSQLHLRQVFVETQTIIMPKPELLITFGRDKFDAEGTLTDEGVRKELERFLDAFVEFVHRVRSGEQILA